MLLNGYLLAESSLTSATIIVVYRLREPINKNDDENVSTRLFGYGQDEERAIG